MATVRINKTNDATWARSWSVDNSAGRTALLATAGTPLGLARGDWIFQVDTSQWYVFAGGTTLLAIIDGSDVARLSAANIFTATPQSISAVNPHLILDANTQAANQRKIAITAGGGDFNFYFLNDDNSNQALFLSGSRSTGLAQFQDDVEVLGLLGVPGGSVVFPGTQVPSSNVNALDDYEEGSWTPVIGGTGGTSGQTYGAQTGRYTKVGKLTAVMFEVQLTNKGTITGNVQISGLPFTAESSPSRPVYPMQWLALGTNWVFIVGLVLESTATMLVRGTTAAATSADTSLVTADITNNTIFRGAAVYMAAA